MITDRVKLAPAAALALALTLPAPAAGQGLLGRVKKAVAEKTVEKAVDRATRKPADSSATAANGSGDASPGRRGRADVRRATSAAAPTFGADLLEITDARVDALIKGLRAERDRWAAVERENAVRDARLAALQRDYEAKRAAHGREQAAYSARYAAWQRCNDSVERSFAGKGVDPAVKEKTKRDVEASNAAAAADLQRRLLPLRDRIMAAQQRGDMAAVQAMSDTLMREMKRASEEAMTRSRPAVKLAEQETAPQRAAYAKCGDRPPEPARVAYPAELAARADADPGHTVPRAGIAASGLSQRQYALLRERAMAYVLAPSGSAATQGFSPTEVAVLARRREELRAYQAEFQRVAVPFDASAFAVP